MFPLLAQGITAVYVSESLLSKNSIEWRSLLLAINFTPLYKPQNVRKTMLKSTCLTKKNNLLYCLRRLNEMMNNLIPYHHKCGPATQMDG